MNLVLPSWLAPALSYLYNSTSFSVLGGRRIPLMSLPSPVTPVEEKVTPGQRIGHTSNFKVGSGCYSLHKHIYSSVVGTKVISHSSSTESNPDNEIPIINVVSSKDLLGVPEVGDTILGKVIRINPRFASLSIMVVGDKTCKESFPGIIHIQDVRAAEKDKVQIFKSFRPGDIVRAQVISLGDANAYYLTTAENDLGVVFAKSFAGATMVPISWEEMQCPVTGAIEPRKAAKIV